ncbi:transmembrane protein, putative (macronuclear) [Tetrahymena thermophila SB210]|uniref:Transmembrane protein, putative n=1 Tax=Tetrahymena thermophila (strain SB210) TaxID=312017 RepID=Q22SL5_TETTS|nr:transmembrane protein, putative [Tetrahymena thermophila SB210]EAR87757.2 transmembrane protein, putative [Tetrahymena thermophila SB210]|eukprot:XP_001008002.2 transmembrane protein, putative [Tetrahymena thermophila SB210]
MSFVESNEFVEVMQEQDDYDVVHKVGEVFGFYTFGGHQKFNPFTYFRKKKKNSSSLVRIEDQEQIIGQKNYYEKLSLIRCQVNVFAMKKFIRNNIKSLREIYIEDCKFYLSDEDANEDTDRVKNQRMLQELNFVWLIEQFKFQDIQSITIKLLKDPFDEPNLWQKKIRGAFSLKSSKVVAYSNSPALLPQRNTIEINENNQIEFYTKEQLIDLFKCEENSKFIEYELNQKQEFQKDYSKEKLNALAQDLIWGDVQDQERFIDKLYDNTLQEIQQNLSIYKKYTKYAFNDSKLIIIGDVLYNGISLSQLYNLIQLNCQKINGIIFKDNGKIPPKVFSDLMKQIFLIPELEQISFLSSVLDESSLHELEYLIQKKQVKFLNLYRSYFLKDEIDILLNMESNVNKLKINHHRFVCIDILQKKAFEFTPYAFNLNELKGKSKDDMLEVERLYKNQMYFPKQVYNQIVFFQGMNLSIVNRNKSEKILFKHWEILLKSKEQQKLQFQSKQEQLIDILDEQFHEDDINVLNYSLIKTLIDQVVDGQIKSQFQKYLDNQKSFKLLKERFSIKLCEKIKFQKESYLQTCYAYMMGFTQFKEFSIYYIFCNSYLYQDVRENNKKFQLELKARECGLIIKESFTAKENDEKAISIIMKELKNFFTFETLTELQINENRDPDKTFLFLNQVFIECKVLKKIKLQSNLLNDIKLKGVDFSLLSAELEEFDICHNKNIDDLSFLNGLFRKCRKLKKLLLQNMQLTAIKAETADFTLISPTLEEVDIGFNVCSDVKYINDIFLAAPNLKKINMTQMNLNTQLFEQIKFAPGLKELNINFNANIHLASLIVHLGITEGLELESLEAYIAGAQETMDKQFEKYSVFGQLKAFQKLKKLHVQRNRFVDPNYLNLILSNLSTGLVDLKITDQKLKAQGFLDLQKDNVYPTLEILDLQYGHEFGNYNFLQDVFEKAQKLRILKIGYSSIVEASLNKVQFETIPETLEEFHFSGNTSYNRYEGMLNKMFKRCQKLKVLAMEDCLLTDDRLKNVDFTEISTALEEFNISNNPGLKTYYFLNDIFRRAKGLKKINLKKNKIGKAVDQINFDLLGKSLEVFSADEDDFFNEEFQDQLINKLERYMNLYNFQQKYSNLANYQYINYFGVFEQYNLSQFRQQKETKNEKTDQQVDQKKDKKKQEEPKEEDKEDKKIREEKEKKEKIQKEEESQKQARKDKSIKWAKKNNLKMADNWIENSTDVKYSQYNNPLFFYSFFSKLDQLIPEKNEDSKKQRQLNTSILLEKIVEYQNIYVNKDYQLLQFIDNKQIKEQLQALPEKSNNTSLDYDLYFTALKELKLTGQKYPNLDFLVYFFQNGQHITKIDMSNMDLKEETVKKITETPLDQFHLNSVIEMNFSGNKNTETNIFKFIDAMIQAAPNIQILKLSDMDMNGTSIPNFDLVGVDLRELDISKNKRIPTLSVLNGLFKKCVQLRKLNISSTGLSDKKLDSTYFAYISQTLEEFDCSNNENLLVVDFINSVISRCQNLIKLNISNCNIDYQRNRKIQYYNLSTQLTELNISKNQIIYFMEFLEDILERCQRLEKFNMSENFTSNQYDSVFGSSPGHNLKDFDFSGCTNYNLYDFIPQIIDQSTQFRRLTIQKINLSQKRLEYFRFKDVGSKILELDISENQNLSDVKDLNYMIDSPDFSVFIANKTSLNNTLINQLNIPDLFKNLKRLELSECINFIKFDFMNQIFTSTPKLEFLNLSGMQITQPQIEQIHFDLISKNLKEFDISQNKLITNFSFLTDLFVSTQNSLVLLNLSDCDLKEEKLVKADFSKMSKTIETIDLSKNEELNQIDFMNDIFSNNPTIKMKKFKISKATYNITYTLQKYCSQIQDIDCPFQYLDLAFFSQNKFITNINFIKFLQYLLSSVGNQGYTRRSSSQTLWQAQDPKGQIFKIILQSMMEFKSEQKPLQTIQHFFFLLLNEEKIFSRQYNPAFFIMSPYFLFQQNQEIECEYDKTKKEKLLIDSFNLTFFDLNLLNKKTDYIFGYDKFFFHEFPDFYVQNLTEKGSDLQFIIELKKKMSKYHVSNAFLPIRLNLNPEILKKAGFNEFEVLYMINFIPPSSMNLKGMSIQFVKSWYAINFYAPLSIQTTIDVDYDLLENSSIANFLTLRSYRLYINNFEGKTFLSQIKQKIGKYSYAFFNILSSQPKQYQFDHTVIHLENRFKQFVVEGKHNILRALYPIYIFICVFGVWFFSRQFNVTCGSGVSWNSYIMYAVFGFVTFFLEAFIFNTCLKYVSHLIPELKPDCRMSFPYPLVNSIKLFIMDVNWINQWYVNYVVAFFLSQLSRFDFFTNIGFLYQTYMCEDYLIFTLALISLSITTFSGIIFFIMNFMGADSYGRLVTGQIDKLYQLCNLLEFQAVADVLDIISPSNSVILFGKMFNQRIINNFIRILCQDIPFIIIQAFYLIQKDEWHQTMIFSLTSSGLMFLVSLNKFLTITPSRLGQEDFNELNNIKKLRVLPNYLSKLSQYESQLVKYNQYEMLKCIKSTKYFQKLLGNGEFTVREIKDQLQMIKDLRSFQSNKDFIQDIFGNEQYNDMSINSNDSPVYRILEERRKTKMLSKKSQSNQQADQQRRKSSQFSKKDSILSHTSQKELLAKKSINIQEKEHKEMANSHSTSMNKINITPAPNSSSKVDKNYQNLEKQSTLMQLAHLADLNLEDEAKNSAVEQNQKDSDLQKETINEEKVQETDNLLCKSPQIEQEEKSNNINQENNMSKMSLKENDVKSDGGSVQSNKDQKTYTQKLLEQLIEDAEESENLNKQDNDNNKDNKQNTQQENSNAQLEELIEKIDNQNEKQDNEHKKEEEHSNKKEEQEHKQEEQK